MLQNLLQMAALQYILEPYGLTLWPDHCAMFNISMAHACASAWHMQVPQHGSFVTAVKCMATCQHLICGLTITLMFSVQVQLLSCWSTVYGT